MQKKDLMEALFERFEAHRNKVIADAQKLQKQISDLEAIYPPEAIVALRLEVAKELNIGQLAASTVSTKSDKSSGKPRERKERQRQKQVRRKPVNEVLAPKIPQILDSLFANQARLTTRAVFNQLAGLVSEQRLEIGHVTKYLKEHETELGIVSQKENKGPAGKLFWSRTTKSRASRRSPNVYWDVAIPKALEGVEMATVPELKKRLANNGVPKSNLKGGGFKVALGRLTESNVLTMDKEGRYRLA